MAKDILKMLVLQDGIGNGIGDKKDGLILFADGAKRHCDGTREDANDNGDLLHGDESLRLTDANVRLLWSSAMIGLILYFPATPPLALIMSMAIMQPREPFKPLPGRRRRSWSRGPDLNLAALLSAQPY